MVFSALGLLGLLLNAPMGSLDVKQSDISNISSVEMFGPQEAESKASKWDGAGGLEPVKEAATNTPVKNWVTELETQFAIDWFPDFDPSAIKRLDHQMIR